MKVAKESFLYFIPFVVFTDNEEKSWPFPCNCWWPSVGVSCWPPPVEPGCSCSPCGRTGGCWPHTASYGGRPGIPEHIPTAQNNSYSQYLYRILVFTLLNDQIHSTEQQLLTVFIPYTGICIAKWSNTLHITTTYILIQYAFTDKCSRYTYSESAIELLILFKDWGCTF